MTEKHYFVRTCYRNDVGQLVSPSPHAKRFIWPEKVGSVVTCPDWDPTSECGHGLHGLRPGDNIPGMWAEGQFSVWMICSYDPKTAVVLGGKLKVPSCVVEYVVDWKDGASTLVPLWLKKHGVTDPIYHGVAEVGDLETVTVGDYGRAIVRNNGHATAGDRGYATAGQEGHAIAGEYGCAVSGWRGHSTVGPFGQATAGDFGTATAGNYGQATAGFAGHAVVGISGHATVGVDGTAMAGENGIIQIAWHTKQSQLRIAVGYVEKKGLKPNVVYKLNERGRFVEVETPNE